MATTITAARWPLNRRLSSDGPAPPHSPLVPSPPHAPPTNNFQATNPAVCPRLQQAHPQPAACRDNQPQLEEATQQRSTSCNSQILSPCLHLRYNSPWAPRLFLTVAAPPAAHLLAVEHLAHHLPDVPTRGPCHRPPVGVQCPGPLYRLAAPRCATAALAVLRHHLSRQFWALPINGVFREQRLLCRQH